MRVTTRALVVGFVVGLVAWAAARTLLRASRPLHAHIDNTSESRGQFTCQPTEGALGPILSDEQLCTVWHEAAFEFPNPRGAFPPLYSYETTQLDAPTVAVTLANAPYVDIAFGNIGVMVATGVMRRPDEPFGRNTAHIQKLVIAALDDETCGRVDTLAAEYGVEDLVLCLPSALQDLDTFLPGVVGGEDNNMVTSEYLAIMQGKTRLVRDFVRCGMNVISMDLDAFIVNPHFAAHLAGPAARGAHMVIQSEGPLSKADTNLHNAHGIPVWQNKMDDICAGFALYRTSPLSNEAFNFALEIEYKHRTTDQEGMTYAFMGRVRTFWDRELPSLYNDDESHARVADLLERGLVTSLLPNDMFLPGFAASLPVLHGRTRKTPPFGHRDSQFQIVHFAGGCDEETTSKLVCKWKNYAKVFTPPLDSIMAIDPLYHATMGTTLDAYRA